MFLSSLSFWRLNLVFQSLKLSAFANCPSPPISHFSILSWSLCEGLSKEMLLFSMQPFTQHIQLKHTSFQKGYYNSTKEHCLNFIRLCGCHWALKKLWIMFHLCYSLSNVFILSVRLQKKDAGEGVYEVLFLCCGCLIFRVAVKWTFLVCVSIFCRPCQ